MTPFTRAACVSAVLLLLAGCASVSPDGGLADVQRLTEGKTVGGDATLSREPTAQTQRDIAALLTQPLAEGAAVRIALLNNPGLHSSLATLGISDADRAQMGRLPNPILSLGRFTEGDKLEIERVLRFDVIGLLTLPWRAKVADQPSGRGRCSVRAARAIHP